MPDRFPEVFAELGKSGICPPPYQDTLSFVREPSWRLCDQTRQGKTTLDHSLFRRMLTCALSRRTGHWAGG